MTTETDLRAALHARADEAPTVDAERLLATAVLDAPALRSTAGSSHGRRWAIAGVAAGFVALATVAGVLVAGGDGPDTSAPAGPLPIASGSASADDVAAQAAAVRAAEAAARAAAAAAASSSASSDANPYDPNAPVPAASDWQVPPADPPVGAIDDSAIVFTDQDAIVAFYVRDHQQLSVVAADPTQKDNSDARWHTAVQVYLPGSGFDPHGLGNPGTVTIDGIARELVTLPRLLGADGPAQVPSLLWQVGDDWVALQVDLPASTAPATEDQLAAAAARVDVHHG